MLCATHALKAAREEKVLQGLESTQGFKKVLKVLESTQGFKDDAGPCTCALLIKAVLGLCLRPY